METEIWKSHPEIDKIEVSSFGRVRSANGHYYKSFLWYTENEDGDE